MAILRSLLALAVALVSLPPLAAAKDEACTYGVDCLCDRFKGDPTVLFCEDFEDPELPNLATRGHWHDKYGVGIQGCTADNTSSALFRTGFYPDPGAVSQNKACVAHVRETSCEVPTQIDCVFQGTFSLGHRMKPGKTGGILGVAKFRKSRRFGLTMMIKWSKNYMPPGTCSECGPAHKMNEFGDGVHPLIGATLGTAGQNHPFAGGILTGGVPNPIASLGAAVKAFDLPFVYFSPDRSRYQWGTTYRADQWGCFQMHWNGWGTASTRFRYWFNGQQIIDGTINSSTLFQNQDIDGIGSMIWNNYYNGNTPAQDVNTGYPPSGTIAYRYEDNVIMTDAAEPVPCATVGFGSSGGTAPAPPANTPPPPPVLLP
jgi:hypothetical protein